MCYNIIYELQIKNKKISIIKKVMLLKYLKKVLGSYNLHMIKTDRFKTITIDLIFRKKIVKEEITKRNFLADMLTFSSKNYPTRRDMAIMQQDLYSCELDFSCYRIGNYYNTDISLLCLNDKYTEKGMNENSMNFFFGLIKLLST